MLPPFCIGMAAFLMTTDLGQKKPTTSSSAVWVVIVKKKRKGKNGK
jgi:hypothetical protein